MTYEFHNQYHHIVLRPPKMFFVSIVSRQIIVYSLVYKRLLLNQYLSYASSNSTKRVNLGIISLLVEPWCVMSKESIGCDLV